MFELDDKGLVPTALIAFIEYKLDEPTVNPVSVYVKTLPTLPILLPFLKSS